MHFFEKWVRIFFHPEFFPALQGFVSRRRPLRHTPGHIHKPHTHTHARSCALTQRTYERARESEREQERVSLFSNMNSAQAETLPTLSNSRLASTAPPAPSSRIAPGTSASPSDALSPSIRTKQVRPPALAPPTLRTNAGT